jgi:hypothetical protein
MKSQRFFSMGFSLQPNQASRQVWDLRASTAARSFEVSSREVRNPQVWDGALFSGASNVKDKDIPRYTMCIVYIHMYIYIHI